MHNKPVKVTENGRRQSDLDLHRTFWGRVWYNIVRGVKFIVKTISIGAVLYGTYLLGGLFNPKVQIVEAEQSVPPILLRISKCESPTGHYAKNGQVVINHNKDGSYDIGKFQVNSVWFAKATALGFDLTKEEDNQKMAEWIYANRGTGDWYSSSKCWQK